MGKYLYEILSGTLKELCPRQERCILQIQDSSRVVKFLLYFNTLRSQRRSTVCSIFGKKDIINSKTIVYKSLKNHNHFKCIISIHVNIRNKAKMLTNASFI